VNKNLRISPNSNYTLENKSPDTLVIYCADPRFRNAFRDFIDNELESDQYILLSVAGGVGPFILHPPDSERANLFVGQMRIFLANNPINRILAINHAGCLWYLDKNQKLETDAIIEKQFSDAKKLIDLGRSIKDGIAVDIYYAALEGENIVFEKIRSD